MTAPKFVTIPQAAAELGITAARVWQIMQEKNLGQRLGRMWILSRSDLRKLTKRRTKRGPRPKA